MSDLGTLTVHTRQLDTQTAVIELHGEMDAFTTPRAKEAVAHLLEGGYRNLLVNLHRTSYLDSTALGMLVGTLRRLRDHGGELRLIAPSHRVRRLLEITRLTFAFSIDASEEEALVKLAGGEEAAR